MSHNNRISYNNTSLPRKTSLTAKCIWEMMPINKCLQPCALRISKCIRQANQTFFLPVLSPCKRKLVQKTTYPKSEKYIGYWSGSAHWNHPGFLTFKSVRNKPRIQCQGTSCAKDRHLCTLIMLSTVCWKSWKWGRWVLLHLFSTIQSSLWNQQHLLISRSSSEDK